MHLYTINTDLSDIKFENIVVNGNTTKTFTFNTYGTIELFRPSSTEYAKYLIENGGVCTLVEGTAPQYATISCSDRTVTITATASRAYFLFAMHN